MNALDQLLNPLGPSLALTCLVKAWRGAASPLLVDEIARRSEVYERTTDWDLDRFDVTTLPRVLSWLCDSGPFSADLEVVLDRIEPFLPDPRAAKPLADLATKKTRAQPRIEAMAERQVLPATSLDEVDVLRQVIAAIADEQDHQRRFQELLREGSLDARAVLADWLMARGEPLGEFVGLQLGRREAPSPRELALWGQYGVSWIRLFLGASLTRAGNGAAIRSQVRFEEGVPVWVEADDLVIADARGPGWRHVRQLKVRRAYRWGAPEDTVADITHAVPTVTTLELERELLDVLVAGKHCEKVRELRLRTALESWPALSRLVLALPALESVRFEGGDTFDAGGLTAALRQLRARSVSVSFRCGQSELTVPIAGRPFLATDEELTPVWKPVLEAVHEVTQQRPALRSKAALRPELERHFLPRDEG